SPRASPSRCALRELLPRTPRDKPRAWQPRRSTKTIPRDVRSTPPRDVPCERGSPRDVPPPPPARSLPQRTLPARAFPCAHATRQRDGAESGSISFAEDLLEPLEALRAGRVFVHAWAQESTQRFVQRDCS